MSYTEEKKKVIMEARNHLNILKNKLGMFTEIEGDEWSPRHDNLITQIGEYLKAMKKPSSIKKQGMYILLHPDGEVEHMFNKTPAMGPTEFQPGRWSYNFWPAFGDRRIDPDIEDKALEVMKQAGWISDEESDSIRKQLNMERKANEIRPDRQST